MTRSFTLTVRQAQSKSNSSQGFTLIELLIVIAIVAILSVVVILALNPGELLKQARDSSRLSDLNSLHKALSLYQVDNPAGSFGTASTTYISYPDSSASCANIGISTSTIASGYAFACAPSSTYQRVNATGWVPVNLSAITGGSPIASLSKDPVNTTSSNNYYQYLGNSNNWALSALLESTKYLASSGQNDGGYDPGRFEKGSNLTLVSQGEGLVGWWTMDEGSGTAMGDKSGNGRNGTIMNSAYSWVPGKSGSAINWQPICSSSCAGINSYAYANFSPSQAALIPGTMMVWAKPNGTNLDTILRANIDTDTMGFDSTGAWFTDWWPNRVVCNFSITPGAWTLLAATHSTSTVTCYQDGVATHSGSLATTTIENFTRINIATRDDLYAGYFSGALDDIRLYGRALSAAEIAAIYNAAR